MEKLSKKAKRVYEFELNNIERRVTIGEVCKDCHTTVLTLFKKTYPELLQKGYLLKENDLYVLSEEKAIEYLTEKLGSTI
mgnify:CR=1 FL=1